MEKDHIVINKYTLTHAHTHILKIEKDFLKETQTPTSQSKTLMSIPTSVKEKESTDPSTHKGGRPWDWVRKVVSQWAKDKSWQFKEMRRRMFNATDSHKYKF